MKQIYCVISQSLDDIKVEYAYQTPEQAYEKCQKLEEKTIREEGNEERSHYYYFYPVKLQPKPCKKK